MKLSKVNLETELLKQNDSNLEAQNLVIKEAESILSENKEEQFNLLINAGLAHSLLDYAAINAKKERNSKFDKRRIFTEDQIKSLCIKYGLRFLPTKYYAGTIHPETHLKIKQFNDEYNEKLTRHDGASWRYEQYSIVAPRSAFKLEKFPLDPLLFIYIGDDMYYLIHKWGEDLSSWRYIANIPFRSGLNTRLTFLVLFSIFTIPLFFGVGKEIAVTSIAIDIVLAGIGIAWMLSCENNEARSIIPDNSYNWDSTFR